MDIISNFIALIKEAKYSYKSLSVVWHSKVVVELLQIFRDLGYITDFKIERYRVVIQLNDVVFTCFRVSRPGKRVYMSYKNLVKFHKPGFLILSTPKGILTHMEACVLHVGGEVLLYIL